MAIEFTHCFRPKRENFLIVPETLSFEIGYEAALILTKIQYWINVSGKTIAGEEGLWIYNSYEQWKKQFHCFSLYKIKKLFANLEESGFLISKAINAKRWDHTKWYSINFAKVISVKKYSQYRHESVSRRSIDRSVENQSIYYKQKYNYIKKSSSIKEAQVVTDIVAKEENIPSQMISVWNEVFAYATKPIKAYNSKKNTATLLQAFAELFQYSLEQWREYAIKVNSSRFLMGEKKASFRASFAWLIKEETIQKILAGEYGVGDRIPDKDNVRQNVEAQKKEITIKISQKVSDRIADIVAHKTQGEAEEFEELVLREEDPESVERDKYGLKEQLKTWHVNAKSLLHCSKVNQRYAMLKESLFETFLLRKYLGADKLTLQRKAKAFLDEHMGYDSRYAFEKLKELDA